MIRVRDRLFTSPHFGRTWHLVDIRVVLGDVRFRGYSGHCADVVRCLLLTQMYGPAVRSKKI